MLCIQMTLRVPSLIIDYYVDRDIFQNHQELLQQKVVAQLYVDGSPPVMVVEKYFMNSKSSKSNVPRHVDLQRNIPMLLRRVLISLRLQHL